jgi:hypothetical protein
MADLPIGKGCANSGVRRLPVEETQNSGYEEPTC